MLCTSLLPDWRCTTQQWRQTWTPKLIGFHEQLLTRPGIYLNELQTSLHEKFGVVVSLPTICRTLQYMGYTRQTMHHVAIQRSDGRFTVEISVYDPTMLVWLHETGRNTLLQYT